MKYIPAFFLGLFVVFIMVVGFMVQTSGQDEYVTVSDTPEPPSTGISPETQKAMDAQLAKMMAESRSIVVAGLETAGSTIQVAGHNVKLPDNIYMDGMLSLVICAPEHPDCDKDLPYLVLRDKNVPEQWLGLKTDTGKIIQDTEHLTDEGRAEQMSRFQWLVEALRTS